MRSRSDLSSGKVHAVPEMRRRRLAILVETEDKQLADYTTEAGFLAGNLLGSRRQALQHLQLRGFCYALTGRCRGGHSRRARRPDTLQDFESWATFYMEAIRDVRLRSGTGFPDKRGSRPRDNGCGFLGLVKAWAKGVGATPHPRLGLPGKLRHRRYAARLRKWTPV